MMLEDVHILVTGGAGFIGSHFVELLLQQFPSIQVTTLDKLTYAGTLENLTEPMKDARHRFIHGDICNRELVTPLVHEADWVVHLAAETHVDRSLYQPDAFLQTDVLGTFTLLEAARDAPHLRGFIHISTDEIYGSLPLGYAHEEAALRPSSPYSASKAAADRLAYAYWVTYGLPVIIVRPCNAYGPRQYPEKLIPFFITRAMRNLPLPLYGDGLHVRDWVFVRDLAHAIVMVMLHGRPGRVYNVGAGNERTNLEVARRIVELVGASEDLIRFVDDRPGHDRRYAMDWSRIRRLGWLPTTPFSSGLEQTVKWYQTHQDHWQKQLDRDTQFQNFYRTHYGKRLATDE